MKNVDKKEYEEWLDTKELQKLIGKRVVVNATEQEGTIVAVIIDEGGIRYRVSVDLSSGEEFTVDLSKKFLELL